MTRIELESMPMHLSLFAALESRFYVSVYKFNFLSKKMWQKIWIDSASIQSTIKHIYSALDWHYKRNLNWTELKALFSCTVWRL